MFIFTFPFSCDYETKLLHLQLRIRYVSWACAPQAFQSFTLLYSSHVPNNQPERQAISQIDVYQKGILFWATSGLCAAQSPAFPLRTVKLHLAHGDHFVLI